MARISRQAFFRAAGLSLFRSLPLGLTGQRAPLSAPRCLPASPDAAPHRAETQWVRCSTLPHGSRAGFAACALAQWPLPRPPSVWYSAHLFSPFNGASRSSTSSQLCGCDSLPPPRGASLALVWLTGRPRHLAPQPRASKNAQFRASTRRPRARKRVYPVSRHGVAITAGRSPCE